MILWTDECVIYSARCKDWFTPPNKAIFSKHLLFCCTKVIKVWEWMVKEWTIHFKAMLLHVLKNRSNLSVHTKAKQMTMDLQIGKERENDTGNEEILACYWNISKDDDVVHEVIVVYIHYLSILKQIYMNVSEQVVTMQFLPSGIFLLLYLWLCGCLWTPLSKLSKLQWSGTLEDGFCLHRENLKREKPHMCESPVAQKRKLFVFSPPKV